MDRRPAATAQQRLQALADGSSRVSQLDSLQRLANRGAVVGQLKNGKGKQGKKGGKQDQPAEPWKPEHDQTQIQNHIIAAWASDYHEGGLDEIRARYAETYRDDNGGWCDGWAYLLSKGVEGLAEMWRAIDTAISTGEDLSMTDMAEAVGLARRAVWYHVINNDPPDPSEAQYADYVDAVYHRDRESREPEFWRHEEPSPDAPMIELSLKLIMAEVKGLKRDETLRMTSTTHDASVRRIKDGYIVSETELHGVQQCDSLGTVEAILGAWKEDCEKNKVAFFSQPLKVEAN